jgi:uncharacterized phage protein (TIGR02218 family)
MGFTDLDRDVGPIDGVLYKAASGYDMSDIVQTSDLAVDNEELDAVLNDEDITFEDVIAGRWDGALIQRFIVNYVNPAQGDMKLSGVRLGNFRLMDQHAIAEAVGIKQKLRQTIGELYQIECRADLGDARCKVNLASFTVAGTVTSVGANNQEFFDSSRTEIDDRFGGGNVTWTLGNNNGKKMEVQSYFQTGGRFVLSLPMFYSIQVGDTYSVYAGCRKRLIEDCKTKFNNIANHRGEAYLPGMSILIKRAS